MWGTLKNWKLLLSLFTTVVIGSKIFTKRKLPFKKEFKYILFHKPAFYRLINSSSENTTVSTRGKRIAAEQQKMIQFLSGSLLKLKPGNRRPNKSPPQSYKTQIKNSTSSWVSLIGLQELPFQGDLNLYISSLNSVMQSFSSPEAALLLERRMNKISARITGCEVTTSP